MKQSELQKVKIYTIMVEYNNINQEIFLIENAIIRDFQILIAFIAALIAISFKTDFKTDYQYIKMLFITFPYIIFAFSLIFIIKLSHLTNLAAYKRIIERRINIIFRQNILNWHSLINKKLYFQFNRLFLLNSFAIASLLVALYSITSIFAYYYIIPKLIINNKICYNILGANYIMQFFKYTYILFPVIIVIFFVLLYYEFRTFPSTIAKLLHMKSENKA